MRLRSYRDAEADFVIAAPDRGILVVEVKGGIIDERDGQWFQNGRQLPEAPLSQAWTAHDAIRTRLKECGVKVPPSDVAVAFPDTWFERPPSNDDLARRIIGKRELGWLDTILGDFFRRPSFGKELEDARFIHKLHEFWGESWVEPLRLGNLAHGDESDFVRLDGAQLRCIDDFLMLNARALVYGGAGSGKTLLVREAARRMARADKRVLLICFTEALGRWLGQEMRADGVATYPIKRLALDLLNRSGASIEAPDPDRWTPEFWNSIVPRALNEAAALILDAKWDVVIVDEAQDLTTDDWELIEALAHSSAHFWAFCDPAQKFWRDRALHDSEMAKMRLTEPYRCDRAIQSLAECYRPGGGRIAEGEASVIRRGVERKRIALTACESRADLPGMIAREISRLTEQGLRRNEIAVISLVGRARKDSVARLRKAGNYTLAAADDSDMDSNAVADTMLRFKGLERAAVIVSDLSLRGRESAETRRAGMYIALTRARSFLRIVDTRQALAGEAPLADLPIAK